MTKARERVLYQETFRKHAAHVRTELNPTLPHVPPQFVVRDCYIEAAGRAACADGVVREFQVLRVYFDERTA